MMDKMTSFQFAICLCEHLQDSTAFTFMVKESGHCVALDQQCLGNLELSVQRLRETWEVELKERERY